MCGVGPGLLERATNLLRQEQVATKDKKSRRNAWGVGLLNRAIEGEDDLMLKSDWVTYGGPT